MYLKSKLSTLQTAVDAAVMNTFYFQLQIYVRSRTFWGKSQFPVVMNAVKAQLMIFLVVKRALIYSQKLKSMCNLRQTSIYLFSLFLYLKQASLQFCALLKSEAVLQCFPVDLIKQVIFLKKKNIFITSENNIYIYIYIILPCFFPLNDFRGRLCLTICMN